MDKRILAPGICLRTRLRPEKPKVAVCSGCGGKYPHQELIELTEDNHDDLTYFHGDCLSCADGAGVPY